MERAGFDIVLVGMTEGVLFAVRVMLPCMLFRCGSGCSLYRHGIGECTAVRTEATRCASPHLCLRSSLGQSVLSTFVCEAGCQPGQAVPFMRLGAFLDQQGHPLVVPHDPLVTLTQAVKAWVAAAMRPMPTSDSHAFLFSSSGVHGLFLNTVFIAAFLACSVAQIFKVFTHWCVLSRFSLLHGAHAAEAPSTCASRGLDCALVPATRQPLSSQKARRRHLKCRNSLLSNGLTIPTHGPCS